MFIYKYYFSNPLSFLAFLFKLKKQHTEQIAGRPTSLYVTKSGFFKYFYLFILGETILLCNYSFRQIPQ